MQGQNQPFPGLGVSVFNPSLSSFCIRGYEGLFIGSRWDLDFAMSQLGLTDWLVVIISGSAYRIRFPSQLDNYQGI
jgi:hypothetical protein